MQLQLTKPHSFSPRRYLDSYFAIHPEIKEDGSNLADAILMMWMCSIDAKGA